MANNRVFENGRYVAWTNNTGTAVVSGQAVIFDGVGRIGVAQVDIANGATGTVDTEGVYDLPKDTAADVFTKGLANNKISATGKIQLNAGGGTLTTNAYVFEASAANALTVRMKLLG